MTTPLQERFDSLADLWQEETALHSFSSIIMRHPAIREIIEMGEPAVPLMLRQWRDHGGLWDQPLAAVTGVSITEGINPLPEVKGWVGVSYPTLRTAWLRWGVENGHLDTIESAPQPVRGGYALRHYGPCANDSCQEARERVYQCPCCTETFCHRCTDILYWEIDFTKICPKCGWDPDQQPLVENVLFP